MRIRLTGTPAECDAVAAALAGADRLEVVEVSKQYPNRGTGALVRGYVEARVTTDAGRGSSGGEK